MEIKIGFIINNDELLEIVQRLYENDIKEGKIILEMLDADTIEEHGLILEKKGAKAIVARSGGYFHSVERVNVPMIELKISTLDVLHAVKAAKRLHNKIVIVLSEQEHFDYPEWEDLINADVRIEKFRHINEIEGIMMKLENEKDDIAVVGGGIPCKVAGRYNIDAVNICASDDSIRDAVNSARNIAASLYDQKYRNGILNTTLDGVHDAVLAADNDGKIIIYNQQAEKLLKRDASGVINRRLEDVFPDLSFMMDVLKNKISKYNEIIHYKSLVATANISLLKVDGHISGVLCSFQDITKLQSLEKKIRYELNKKGLVAKYKFEDIISNDAVMKNTIRDAVKIGHSEWTAMIYGESGTGKEMIAQSIHNISSRKNEPFVAVNCAALSESLLESELFGYEEGAFTGARKGGKAGLFELAHGGTIFLDEINSISPNLQSKLLRVLEEKEVMRIGSDYVIPLDVRVLAAANEKLNEKIEDGSFRKDLFYRLSVLELQIPPLRERKSDIIPLFKYYLSSAGSEKIFIDEDTEKKLTDYYWPGNVRELKNVVQRYMIFGEINLGDDAAGKNKKLIKENAADSNESGTDENKNITLELKEINKFVESKVIEMLEKQGMSKNEIARTLGISRSSLWNKQNN
ncbi:sigma 54-interacting transcriptional regulator [Sedimentibacter sp.]|uniref:sigma 54-interacting transcriptional regulator n=1 Tax=Sedimentibacter sp. TaxID=1960295 RepID=UPI00289F1FD7|nr:sigma 54-interacting transcriptional regulator [Sedimentibacter sp.]